MAFGTLCNALCRETPAPAVMLVVSLLLVSLAAKPISSVHIETVWEGTNDHQVYELTSSPIRSTLFARLNSTGNVTTFVQIDVSDRAFLIEVSSLVP